MYCGEPVCIKLKLIDTVKASPPHKLMTTIRLSTIGWSIDQWNSLQCSLQPEDALQNIIDLVSTFDSTDPAWITIASKELLKSQWEALPTDGKVSICTQLRV